MQFWHPLTVHFPIGTLVFLGGWDLLRPVDPAARKLRAGLYAWGGFWILVSALTGYHDLSLYSSPPPSAGIHQFLALLLGIFSLWMIGTTLKNTLSPFWRRLLAAGMLLLVVLQGYTGGLMGHGG